MQVDESLSLQIEPFGVCNSAATYENTLKVDL